MSDLSWRKVARLFELEQLLHLKPRTTSELAEHFHATEIATGKLTLESAKRNLRRDLEFLMRDQFKRGIQKSNSKTPTYHIPKKLILNQQEVLAVHTLIRLFEHHAPTKSEIYHRVIQRITKQLPEHIQKILERHTKQQKTERPQQLSRTLEKVNTAWVERRQIKFKYLKPGGSGTWRDNTVSIYFCEISRTNLDHYIIGYEHEFHQNIRTFKLSRIKEAEPQNTTYDIPEDFNPTKYLGNAWGIIGESDGHSIPIRLRFAASVLHRLDEGGYPNMQTIKDHPDGSRTIEVRAGTNKDGIPLEVLVWARSWGANVEILEPKQLRELWLEDARELLEKYGGSPE
jgi:predicted DNA-binding transcriptional regulator YafY